MKPHLSAFDEWFALRQKSHATMIELPPAAEVYLRHGFEAGMAAAAVIADNYRGDGPDIAAAIRSRVTE